MRGTSALTPGHRHADFGSAGEISREESVRKLILIVLAGAAVGLAVPRSGSATPLSYGSGLAAAADTISNTEQVWHRHWHHRHWHHHHHGWRHHRWHHHHW